jgi:arylsulfatase A-like enzyme
LKGALASCIVLHPRLARRILAGLLGALIVLAALSSGRQAIREHYAAAALPGAPQGARNVVLIVWDTVRADNLSVYHYPRATTPNLVRWARTATRYALSLAPAPWTFPSHCCFFTGQWPYTLNSNGQNTLDGRYPTLAEYLASRGYQTAGFAANTYWCSYESGIDRGFSHYEDYPLTPGFLLGRTVPGAWILKNIIRGGAFYDQKWIRLQSRDARGINNAFLKWLARRRPDRPFFAFLNYFDAHDPYVPPARFVGRFGISPKTPRDYQFLFDLAHTNGTIAVRDAVMARDCYDDCIAFLDDQLGRLLAELRRQGLLDHTLVIITSDHGEAFGVHGVFGHGGRLDLEEIGVPLVILFPDAPARRIITEPVSLRDLPATVVDQLGLSAGSPFPGLSLASWRAASGSGSTQFTPAFSELAHPTAFEAQPKSGLVRRGVQMSLVAFGQHYVRDGGGSEQLYDVVRDPLETKNLVGSTEAGQVIGIFRRMLLRVLTDDPGAIAVENAYLKPYREWLKALVTESSVPHDRVSALE